MLQSSSNKVLQNLIKHEKAFKRNSRSVSSNEKIEIKNKKIFKKLKAYLIQFINTSIVQIFINVCVVVNIIVLCLDTYKELSENNQIIFEIIDAFCFFVFLIEFFIKIFILKSNYFRSVWNLIDFLTLIFGLIYFILQMTSVSSAANITVLTATTTTTNSPMISSSIIRSNNTTNSFDFNLSSNTQITEKHDFVSTNFIDALRLIRVIRVLRALRSLRILKTLKLFTSLQIIIKTFIQSLQSMGAIIILMSLILYVFAVIGCGLFHKVDEKYFGDLFNSMFTLVQIITLDDWYSIYKINKYKSDFETRLLVLFLLVYILIEYYILLNLMLAVLVDNFQSAMDDFKSRKKLTKIIKETQNDLDSINNNSDSIYDNLNCNINKNHHKTTYDRSCIIERNFVDKMKEGNTNNNNNNKDDYEEVEEDDENDDYWSEDDDDDDDDASDIYGQFHPYSKNLDPTMPLTQRQLIERHFQLLNTIEYYMYEKENIFHKIEYIVEKTADDHFS